jgi:hypothetical protein
MGNVVKHFRELRVYREAFDSAMLIFDCSKEWPKEERYSLTDPAFIAVGLWADR